MNPYRKIFQSLNDAGIRYVVVGGVPRISGNESFMAEIELLLDLDQSNLKKTKAVIEKLRFRSRLPITLETFSDAELVSKWIEEKNITKYSFDADDLVYPSISVLLPYSLKFALWESKKEMIHAWDIGIPTFKIIRDVQVDREYLRRCKQTTANQRLEWLAMALEFVGAARNHM